MLWIKITLMHLIVLYDETQLGLPIMYLQLALMKHQKWSLNAFCYFHGYQHLLVRFLFYRNIWVVIGLKWMWIISLTIADYFQWYMQTILDATSVPLKIRGVYKRMKWRIREMKLKSFANPTIVWFPVNKRNIYSII